MNWDWTRAVHSGFQDGFAGPFPWPAVLFWGFWATLVITTLMAAGYQVGYTRISIPFLLGSILTPSRRKARIYGLLFHFGFGWVFAFIYAFAFAFLRRSDWWIGAILGTAHGSFLLAVILPVLPSVHHRMATEEQGPDPTRQLEPPGFLGLNYGRHTPLVTFAGHVAYGILLGALL